MNRTRVKNAIKKFLRPIYIDICIKRILNYYNKKLYGKILKLKTNYLRFLKDKDIDIFKEVKHNIEEINIKNLSKKENIKIGFVLYTSSMWSCDKLFKMLQQNKRYELYIIICEINDGTEESRKKNYNATLEYFKQNGYPVIGLNEKKEKASKEMDVIFYLTPFSILPNEMNIQNLPLRILTIHIPYSFMVAEREEKFDLLMYQLTWKFFVDTLIYKKLMKEKCLTGDDNVIFCGYTRMDEFIQDDDKTINEKLWKIPKNNGERVYKIIYAPHHSVFNEEAGFSTFDQNYLFIYNLAKKYKNNTSWIIKPHPLLRGRIVNSGFFKDVSEYDNYLNMWNELPNAKVVTDGTYFDIFKTSDTMILDSVSFLAEYQYVHKPLLLLTRETQHFNSFGEKLKEILYCTEGDNFDNIEKYLKEVIIEEKDSMKDKRMNFFDKYLNYYDYNNQQLSSEYIYNYLENTFREIGEKNERK